MRVIIAGGGTAGHINPALSIGEYIKTHDKNAKILYIGTKNSMEEKLVSEAGFNFRSIKISGFRRKLTPSAIKKNIITLKRIITSSFESKKIIKGFKPDICVGTGGYVSGPVLRSAAKLGVKIVIHEQNAFPGLTTKLLAKLSSCIMLGAGVAKKRLNNIKNNNLRTEIVGNPVRKEILAITKIEARKKLQFDSRPVILSFGGSLGAEKINLVIADLIKHTIKNKNKYYHVHAYGKQNKNFLEILQQKNVNLKSNKNIDVREYIKNMPEVLMAADLIICRAVAITLAEILAAGKASVIIPSPNVSKNHQFYNAMELVKVGAAVIIEEKQLTPSKLIETVDKIISSEITLKNLSENAKKNSITNANEKIFRIIKNIVLNNKNNK